MAGPPPSERARMLAEQRRARNADDPCDIVLRVDLMSVHFDSLSSIRINTILNVELQTEGPYSALVCVVSETGKIVGTLAAFPGLGALLRCVQQGVKFEALVVLLASARCAVVVSRKIK